MFENDIIWSKITENIFRLLKEKNITPYRLSKDCNIPASSISSIKNGHFNWRVEHLISISKYLDISLDELLGLKSNPDKHGNSIIYNNTDGVKEEENKYGKTQFKNVMNVPIVGSVGCGTPLKEWENYGDEYIALPDVKHYAHPFILIARGDSMRPYINPGDKLLCVDEPRLIKDRKAVVVSFKTEPETMDGNVKLIKYLSDGMIMLYSVNTKFDPMIVNEKDIYKIFKLVRIIREVK